MSIRLIVGFDTGRVRGILHDGDPASREPNAAANCDPADMFGASIPPPRQRAVAA